MSALSPDARDALLAELRRRTSTPGFHFLSPRHLQRLNEVRSDGAPVVSVFMELTPEMRVSDSWEIVLKDLRKRGIESNPDHADVLNAEMDRVEAALRTSIPRTGRGAAFFACRDLDLFVQLGTAIDLPNLAYVGREPYVRPLARVRDENDRFVIALVSAHKSRFFFSQIGLVEEVFDLVGQELNVTDFATKDQRQDMKADLRRNQAKKSAHALELIAKEMDARHVIYSCASDMEKDFLEALDQQTRQRVSGTFSCEVNATTAEVAEAAEPTQREVEAREEIETIEKVQELLSSRAVVGLDDTLDMLNQQRVMTLVVDDEVHMEGGIDRESGMLTTQTSGTYEATGGEISREADLVEAMLDRAMAQGASLELVRSEAAKAALGEHGPTAAILRF
ncbi:MAG: peptide chain release factor 1 [Bacteroidota bacterium]